MRDPGRGEGGKLESGPCMVSAGLLLHGAPIIPQNPEHATYVRKVTGREDPLDKWSLDGQYFSQREFQKPGNAIHFQGGRWEASLLQYRKMARLKKKNAATESDPGRSERQSRKVETAHSDMSTKSSPHSIHSRPPARTPRLIEAQRPPRTDTHRPKPYPSKMALNMRTRETADLCSHYSDCLHDVDDSPSLSPTLSPSPI